MSNWYQCMKCGKPCDAEHLMGHFSAGIPTRIVSKCCSAPVKVKSK